MTERYYTLTVALERSIREDDAEPILHAIRMIKGVLDVKGNVADPTTWVAEEKAKRELGEKLLEIVFTKEKDGPDKT